jgi:SsrA-binding protein
MRGWHDQSQRHPGESSDLTSTFPSSSERKRDSSFRCHNGNVLRSGGSLMVRPRHASFDKKKVVAENRRARFDYAIDEVFEAGIALTGTEVKSLRFGEGSIAESYAEVKDGEVWLVNSNVPEFSHGNRFNHEPKRPRKLLLNNREIEKLFGAVARHGMTLVPLSIYFNSRGRAKVELALARGRKLHDKREYEKEKDWKKEQGRLLRQHG